MLLHFMDCRKLKLHLQIEAFISLIHFLLMMGHHRNYTNVMIFSEMVF